MLLRCSFALAFAGMLIASSSAQGWPCYGGNAQHSGLFNGTSQTAGLVKWSASLDDNRNYYGSEVLIHYAAPMVTPSDNVVYGYRFTTTTTNGGADYDNWKVIGRSGSNGNELWSMSTDYSAAVIYPNDWTSVFPITLYETSASSKKPGVAAAAAGGSIMIRPSGDLASSAAKRLAFYTTPADYTKNAAAYSPIKINTPLTADSAGNIYFGYEVTSSLPSNLSSLGTGGVAEINVTTGKGSWVSAQSMSFDTGMARTAMNAAPALSADGKYIYVAMVGNNPWLVKLAVKGLTTAAKVQLFDPSVTGGNASLINESSASPMVGVDGHVFMGVFGNGWRESHGWMLQFDGNLSQKAANGSTYPVGAFGWDDTAVVVPSNIVPSYKGKAPYLLLTKYNNYDDNGGDPGADGSNKVAVLDPTSNTVSKDRQSGIPVMNEVLTILGPTKTNNDSQHPNAVNEWCINSAAVDVERKSAIINSEDGHMYRWSFVTNTLTEGLNLQPATGEAYTETAIGPDGQIYVINNAIMFAIGSNNAASVKVSTGTGAKGNNQSLWYLGDAKSYSATSVTTANGDTVAVEVDFNLSAISPNQLSINSNVSTSTTSATPGTLQVYNVKTKAWVTVATQPLSLTASTVAATITSNVENYIGKGGQVRVLFTAQIPSKLKSSQFSMSIDYATCGAL